METPKSPKAFDSLPRGRTRIMTAGLELNNRDFWASRHTKHGHLAIFLHLRSDFLDLYSRIPFFYMHLHSHLHGLVLVCGFIPFSFCIESGICSLRAVEPNLFLLLQDLEWIWDMSELLKYVPRLYRFVALV